jgi:hypothetical protein
MPIHNGRQAIRTFMMKIVLPVHLWIYVLGVCGSVSCAPGAAVPASGEKGFPDSPERSKPLVIWFHHVDRDSRKTLETALGSGLVTHVIFYTSNRWTGDVLQDPKRLADLTWAVGKLKEVGVKSILVRNLWPTRPIGNLDDRILFDPNYYIQEITKLKQEARSYRTDFVGLDIEAYGGERSPVGTYLRWISNYQAKDSEIQNLKQVMAKVIQSVGTVDFLYPGGSLRGRHFFNTLSELGRIRIAESTYYDNEAWKSVRYPYEIFGVYISTRKNNPAQPQNPYYRIQDVFEQSQRWSRTKGIFLYPKEDMAPAVAAALAAYSKTLPPARQTSGGNPSETLP